MTLAAGQPGAAAVAAATTPPSPCPPWLRSVAATSVLAQAITQAGWWREATGAGAVFSAANAVLLPVSALVLLVGMPRTYSVALHMQLSMVFGSAMRCSWAAMLVAMLVAATGLAPPGSIPGLRRLTTTPAAALLPMSSTILDLAVIKMTVPLEQQRSHMLTQLVVDQLDLLSCGMMWHMALVVPVPVLVFLHLMAGRLAIVLVAMALVRPGKEKARRHRQGVAEALAASVAAAAGTEDGSADSPGVDAPRASSLSQGGSRLTSGEAGPSITPHGASDIPPYVSLFKRRRLTTKATGTHFFEQRSCMPAHDVLVLRVGTVLRGVPELASLGASMLKISLTPGCVTVSMDMILCDADGEPLWMDGTLHPDAEAALLANVTTCLLEAMPLRDGERASIQAGGGTPPAQMRYCAAQQRFVCDASGPQTPSHPSGAPLLAVTTPLLVAPRHRAKLRMQVKVALMADTMGSDTELHVGFAPHVRSSLGTGCRQLVRERMSVLQARAVAARKPPGLLDIELDLGARCPSGDIHVTIVDGPCMLASDAVPLLPYAARPAIDELSRLALGEADLTAVVEDLAMLLAPSVPAEYVAVLQKTAEHMLKWAASGRRELPETSALVRRACRSLDARAVRLDSSSLGGAAAAAAATAPTPLEVLYQVVHVACGVPICLEMLKASPPKTVLLACLATTLPAAISAALWCAPGAAVREHARLPRCVRCVHRNYWHRVWRVAVTFAVIWRGSPLYSPAVLKLFGHVLVRGFDVMLPVAFQVFEPLPSWEEAVTFSLLADIPTYGCVLVACRSNGLLLSMRHILLRACVSACISVAWNTYLWRVRRAAPEGKVKET